MRLPSSLKNHCIGGGKLRFVRKYSVKLLKVNETLRNRVLVNVLEGFVNHWRVRRRAVLRRTNPDSPARPRRI
jgi:hypothetical protein